MHFVNVTSNLIDDYDNNVKCNDDDNSSCSSYTHDLFYLL